MNAIQTDDFCDKEKLFAYTSIAEWILPAVYMGHIDCIVWVKPPWSSQMMDGEHSLVVGRDDATGHLRLVCHALWGCGYIRPYILYLTVL